MVVDISRFYPTYYSYPSAAQVTNSDFIGPSCGSPTASVTASVGALLRGSRPRSTWDFLVLVKPEMDGLMIIMIDRIWPATIGSRTTFFELWDLTYDFTVTEFIKNKYLTMKNLIWPKIFGLPFCSLPLPPTINLACAIKNNRSQIPEALG